MFYEAKIKYEKQQEDGSKKMTTEVYLVEAESIGDAENRIIEEMSAFIDGEFEVTSVKQCKYSEMMVSDGTKYYTAKINIITLDEKSGKEKKTPSVMLVGGDNFAKAYNNWREGMKGSMLDFELEKFDETKILDIFYIPTENDETES